MGRKRKPVTPDELGEKLIQLRAAIEAVRREGLAEVATQARHAELQSEFWATKQILADIAGDSKEARYCSREALNWEEQKTRAIKYSIADRITALEQSAESRGRLRQGLRAIAGGKG